MLVGSWSYPFPYCKDASWSIQDKINAYGIGVGVCSEWFGLCGFADFEVCNFEGELKPDDRFLRTCSWYRLKVQMEASFRQTFALRSRLNFVE